MLCRWLLVFALVCSAAATLAQTDPSEFLTFTSQGKPVSCPVYASRNAGATIIFLRGANPDEIALSQREAHFFADHGFRVLMPDYLSVTPTTEATPANYRSWAMAVEDIVADLRARPALHGQKLLLAGQGLGASVALIAGSQRLDVQAIAEWSGLLPNQFFAQVQNLAPLLILHGELDEQVAIVNARQLVRLCQLRDFTCELQIYAGEGHIFSAQITNLAEQRVLAFFRSYVR